MVSREGHCLTDLLYRQQTQGLPIDVIAVLIRLVSSKRSKRCHTR